MNTTEPFSNTTETISFLYYRLYKFDMLNMLATCIAISHLHIQQSVMAKCRNVKRYVELKTFKYLGPNLIWPPVDNEPLFLLQHGDCH